MASPEERDKLIRDEDFKRKLLSIAYGLINNTEDAKDIVQDVMLDIIEKSKEQVEEVEHLKAFVIRMVKNQAISAFKKQIRQRTVSPEILMEEGHFIDPVFKFNFSEIEKAIKNKNNSSESLIFNLHFLNGKTDKEISAITGKKAGNVRKKIAGIRKWAKTYFKK